MSIHTITFTQTQETTDISIVDIDGEGVRHTVKLKVNRILKDSTPIDFHSIHKALRETEELGLYIESPEGVIHPVGLDEETKKRLIIILQEHGKMSETGENFKFQCSHFASLVAGILPTSQKSDWDFTFLSNYQFLIEPPEVEHSLTPGDTIFLGRIEHRGLIERLLIASTAEKVGNGLSVEKNPYHFAVYLGNGLYISKFSEHNIGVSSYAAMRELYSCNDVFLVTPNTGKISLDAVKKWFS